MDPTYKKNFIKAGNAAKEVREFGKALIVPGASYNDIIKKVRSKIYQLGATPAFPPQIALNDVAAHFLPDPEEDIILTDQLVKFDVGLCVDGAIGDCAVSVDLSGKHKHIIDAANEALLAAEQSLYVGMAVSQIGQIIEETILSKGLKSVRNLSGHGLGFYKVHTAPSIPNYNDGSKQTLKPGMTFAIEPFATNGAGMIYDAGNPMLFSVTPRHKRYDGFVKQVYDIALSFKGLPFCLHDLITDLTPVDLVRKALRVMLKDGTLADYAPLIEEAAGFVAQAENSVLIDEQGQIIITTR